MSLLMSAINIILSTNENDIINLPIQANLNFSTFSSILYIDIRKKKTDLQLLF